MRLFARVLLFVLVAGLTLGPAIIGCDDVSKSDDTTLATVLALIHGDTPYRIDIDYRAGDFPDSIDHAHYSALDADGNTVYTSADRPISDFHRLRNLPGSARTITLEYHTLNHEEMYTETHPIDFTAADTVFIAPQYHAPNFDPGRLAIVDEIGGNLLVRGNFPMVPNDGAIPCYTGQEHCFAYNEFDTRMKELVPGFDLDEYEIIDVSLIDNRGTRDELIAEMNSLNRGLADIPYGDSWLPFDDNGSWDPKTVYISTNAEKKPWGVVWWPIWACPKDHRPCTTDDLVILNRFRFLEAPAYLKELLTTPAPAPGKKRLVYFHCVQGTDRTGALHINYIMDNNPGTTFAQAIQRATIGARQGSEEQQLYSPLVPMCTYVGQSYRYCLEKNKANPDICIMPGGFDKDATLCKYTP